MIETVASPWMWAGFTGLVLALLAVDLGVFHRKAHAVSLKEALAWSVVWVTLALLFGAGVFLHFGPERGLEFATGYVLEKALAVDNIFVFVILFGAFAVPLAYQHRVLFWGIVGALVLRGVFILAGAALLQRFHWVLYVFGAILLLTGIRLLFHRDEEPHPERNPLFRLFRRLVPSVPEYHGPRFAIKKDGRYYATPLLLVLVAIEASDVVFAVDSIPAIFAVTSDPFIVFTSNIFAILGLRSMYFLLAGVIERFAYVKVGLALVLAFVGVKMLIMDVYKIPIVVSLAAVAALLGGSIVFSMLRVSPRGSGATPAANRAPTLS
jgi:tellurite resistance protein TerC